MLRGNMMRMAWVVSAIAMVSGCTDCGPTPVADCTDTTATFTGISAGATVSSPLDAFSVDIKSADGSAFPIDAGQVRVGGMTFTGTVDGSRVTFSGVTAAAGAQTVSVSIAAGSCTKTYADLPITVRDVCSTPAVTSVTFPQDTRAPLGTLNSTELPSGTHLSVQVNATCTAGVQVRIKRGTDIVGALTDFTNGRAEVSLPTLPNGDGRYELVAELVKDGVALPTTPSANAAILVALLGPAVTVVTTGTLGPADDLDPQAAGFQVRVSGTVAPIEGVSCTMTVTGADQPVSGLMPNMLGEVSADFTLTSGTVDVTLVCVDNSDNSATGTGQFVIDLVPPTVRIDIPAANPDGGATLVTRSPQSVLVATDAPVGSMVMAYRVQGATRTSVTSTTVMAGGTATFNVPFPADGVYDIVVEVTDPAGNVGSATRSVEVSLTGCGMGFIVPGICPAYVRQTAYTLQTQSKSVCAGQPARLFRSVVQADGGVGAPAAVGTAVLSATGTAGFATTNSDGTYLFRAEVDDVGADAGVSFVECEVLVDTSRPTFTSPPPPTSGAVVINQTQDSQAATPGAQRSIGFTAVVPTGGHVELCIDNAALAPNGAVDCPGGPTGWKVLNSTITTGQVVTLPEGAYSVKLVVVGGSLTVDSAPLAVNVDVTAPCVSSAGVTLPQDTAPADGQLNAAEVGSNPPRISLSLNPACGTAASAVVRNVTGGAVGSTSYSTTITTVTSPLTIDLTTNVPSTASLDLFVLLTDAAGNTNVFRGLTQDVPARKSVTIDRDLPACSISQPSKVGALNTLDLPAAGAGQYTLTAIAQTSADVPSVSFKLGAAAAVSAPVSGTSASTGFTVSGTQTAQNLVVTCVDGAQNSVQVQRSLDWDLDVPTCSFVAPLSGATSTSTDITTTVTVNGAPTRPVTIRSSLQVADIGTLTVSGTSATGLLSYPNGTQSITASLTDAAGNPCSVTSTNVVVNSTTCGLQLTSGFVNGSTVWMNRNNSTPTGATTSTGTITATSTCLNGFNVTLTRTAPSTQVVATQATTGGAVSFAGVALSDGEQYSVVIDNGAGLLTTRTFSVDLVAPVVGAATINAVAAPATSLFFVAPLNNRRVETATAGYFADADGATAGAQFALGVANIQNAFQGALPGAAEVAFKGSTVSTTPITTSPFTLSLPSVTLPHADTGAFAVRVVDQAGNVTPVISQTATIDVIAPAAPSVTRTLTSARAASVTLQWAPVYDDGSTSASGNVFDYDVRWTTSSAASGMADATAYFGSSTFRDSATAASATTLTRVLNVPPLNSYYIAVRARDEVDNYSTFAAPPAVDNQWTRITLSGTTGSSFGSTVATGASLNNDSSLDLAVAAASISLPGSVQVFYGGSSLAGQTTCTSPACTSLTSPDAIGVNFGSDLSMAGNLGDAAGEGKVDLAVGQSGFPTSTGEGRVFIYFGTSAAATLSTSTFIEIRGSTTLAASIGSVVKIISDIDGDSLSELVLAAPSYNGNLGRLYIFKGRTLAQWQAARTATDGTTMAPYIPIASADWIIEGPSPAFTTASGYFGRLRFGVTSIGDLNGDGRAEFSTGMGRSTVNRVQLFNGATVAGTASPMLNSVGLQTFLPPEGVGTDTNNLRGFGSSVLGGFNLTNGSANDVAVSWIARPGSGAVYIYADPTSLGVPASPSLTLEGPLLFGSQVSAGQLSSDSNVDLVVGVDTTTSASGYVLWSQSGSFDTPVGVSAPKFWFSRIDGAAIAGSTSTSLGRWNAVGDLNADGSADLVLADQQNSAVHIFR